MKLFLIPLLFMCPLYVGAQEVHQELQETVRAEVTHVLSEKEQDIIGTDTHSVLQEIQVRILGGEKEGDAVAFENDLIPVEVGDSIYVNRLITIDGIEYYTFKDIDRVRALAALIVVFVLTLVLFSGFHGLRSVLSLIFSVLVLFFVLVPLILKGYSPVLVSVLIAGPILAITLFTTHGFHPRSIIALIGTFGAVVLTGFLATFWVKVAHFTGLSSDEAIYLNFSTHGALDFGGIVLGSIIIGILGILDDVAITQASVVTELKRANHSLRFFELYTRALRVGRDHIGSLVNTLSLAYIGASLPLVLLMVQAESSFTLAVNQELVAVELVRIFVGSIGLILAVPLTTLIAAFWYERYPVPKATDHSGHTH